MNNIIEFVLNIINETGKGIKGFAKAQFILMAVTFAMLASGFFILDIRLAMVIAFAIALIDVIPVVGSGIIMIPWALINIFTGSTEKGAGIAVLYFIVVITRQLLEPKIIGDQIGIRPLYTFLASLAGSFILGPIGFIIGPIVAVVINAVKKYSKR